MAPKRIPGVNGDAVVDMDGDFVADLTLDKQMLQDVLKKKL